MAHLDVSGLREEVVRLKQMGEDTGKIADAMLGVAGRLVAEGYQYSLASHRHVDTGTLFDSIKPSRPKTRGGIRQLTVAPRGTHSKDRYSPIANAYKGTILNSGRHGTKWADEARENTAEPAVEAMENVFDEWLWTGKIPSAGMDWAEEIAFVSN